MTKKNKTIIKVGTKLLFVFSLILFSVALCLFCVKFGLGISMCPPFCWASFLKMSVFSFSVWAFNKELFFY